MILSLPEGIGQPNDGSKGVFMSSTGVTAPKLTATRHAKVMERTGEVSEYMHKTKLFFGATRASGGEIFARMAQGASDKYVTWCGSKVDGRGGVTMDGAADMNAPAPHPGSRMVPPVNPAAASNSNTAAVTTGGVKNEVSTWSAAARSASAGAASSSRSAISSHAPVGFWANAGARPPHPVKAAMLAA